MSNITHRGSTQNKSQWETSEFPILCETCLGPNPFVRMTKADFDKECKICTRPFTIFKWRPGSARENRYKKTEICQVCSKLKNVCQTCLLDLTYGLPVQVRDSALPAEAVEIPQSDVGREWFAQANQRKVEQGLVTAYGDYGQLSVTNGVAGGPGQPTLSTDMIGRLARTTPYYKRNRAHICSFYVKGNCNRGDECPYRHEMPETGELAVQNIKDRYYGVNDPVANKMMRKARAIEQQRFEPPSVLDRIPAPPGLDLSRAPIGSAAATGPQPGRPTYYSSMDPTRQGAI